MGPVLGPHARTDRTRDTRAAKTPAARPCGTQGLRATETVLDPIPAHPCPQHMDNGPRQPPGGGQSEGGERPASERGRHGPRGGST